MDTSKEYVAMCRCQELAERHLEGGDFYSRNGSTNVVKWSSQSEAIWLPRQDQLQEMVRGCRCPSCLSCKVDRFLNGTLDHFCVEQMQEAAGNEHSWTGPTSMEQVWLSVVMHENYDKYWTGKSWVNAKQEQQLAEAIAEWVATINAATIDQRSA